MKSLTNQIPEEESKIANSLNVKDVKKIPSQLQRAKDSIRKLPMFEIYDQQIGGEYDFEWPQTAQLKQVTQIKQMRLKEIRYQQDSLGIITAIKIVCNDFASPFFSVNQDKKYAPIILNAQSFYDNKDGHYRVNNIAARIEFNNMISNIYFNKDKQGI